MRKIVPENAILIPPEAERVFQGVIFDVYQWQQELFDGSMATFERIKRADTVLAICIVDDKILVVEDEQPGRAKTVKFPGGRVDPEDGSTIVATKREIHEETGYEFAQWELASVVQPENKIEWFVYIYIANNVIRQQLVQDDAGEKTESILYSFDEVKQMVHEGRECLAIAVNYSPRSRLSTIFEMSQNSREKKSTANSFCAVFSGE